MTTDAVSYLSTMPHKMSRDIRLSNDIGRDSNFDPFKKKDMTLMFGKPKERNSAQLMYFAEKPMRRPHGSVQMGKQSDPRKGGTVSQPKDTINQSAYTPKYTHQDCPKSVGFTQGLRFQTESYRDVVLEERKQVILTRRQPGDPAHPLIEGTAKDRSIANVKAHKAKPLVTRPDSSRANSIGKQAGRGWEHLRPKTTDRSLRYTTFPWEKNQRPASGLSGDPASGHPGEDGNRPSSALLGGTNADTSSINDTERPRAKSAAVGGGTEEEQEENWLKERKNLLVRCGLNGGGGRRERLRRRAKPKGADFGSTTGREAPVFDLAEGKTMSDLFYNAKYDATGRERKKYADVKLDKYSSRAQGGQPSHVETVNKVLTIPNLVKFHQAKLKADSEGALAVPSSAPPSSVTKVPLSGADDFATHPKSLHAPSSCFTRQFKGTPDMNMFCDRPNEPLEKILGGSRRKYERMFRKEDKDREAAQLLAAQQAQQHSSSM